MGKTFIQTSAGAGILIHFAFSRLPTLLLVFDCYVPVASSNPVKEAL